MISNLGWKNLVQSLSSIGDSPSRVKGKSLIIGRVTDIILDSNHPQFQELGGWQSIGTIFFESVGKFNVGVSSNFAKPFFPNIQNYPLVNELVLVISAPTSIQNSNSFTSKGYYISSIDLWNTPHFNALPNPSPNSQNSKPDSVIGVVNQTEEGDSIPTVDPNSPTNPTQTTFVEKNNINPLQSYAGDIIYEGRFGQSIRFGNTAMGTNNTWSSTGNNGDPIMIIRNGQAPFSTLSGNEERGWVPTTENINKDLSTVYLTSTQKLEVDNNTINRFTGFNTTSTKNLIKTLNEYTGPQIFANTDRIVLNAKNDSIFIGSKRDINISTDESVNIASQNLRVEIGNIQLGGEDATQAIVLGNTFMEELNILLQGLSDFCQLLAVAKDKEGSPYTSINAPASSLKDQIDIFQGKSKTFLSSYSFTK